MHLYSPSSRFELHSHFAFPFLGAFPQMPVPHNQKATEARSSAPCQTRRFSRPLVRIASARTTNRSVGHTSAETPRRACRVTRTNAQRNAPCAFGLAPPEVAIVGSAVAGGRELSSLVTRSGNDNLSRPSVEGLVDHSNANRVARRAPRPDRSAGSSACEHVPSSCLNLKTKVDRCVLGLGL